MSLTSIPKTHWLLFLGSVFILIFHHIFGTIGHYGFDDMEYARIAQQLSEGEYDQGSHFTYRWALVFPLALSYLIFGVNDLSSVLPSLICASLVLFFILLFFKDRSWKQLSLALALTLFSPWFLRYSDLIMADIFVVLAFIAASYFLWKAQQGQLNPKRYGLFFALSLFYGLLSKGSIVLIFPAVLFIFLINLFGKKQLKFWWWSAVFGLLLLGLYFLAVYGISGNPTQRFTLIAENSYLNRCSYGAQGLRVLIERITVDFLRMLQADHLLPYYLMLIPPVLYFLIKRKLSLNDPLHFLSLFALMLLLAANFMSISLSSYNPMCLDIRHYLYLIPLSAIPIAMLLFQKELLGKLKWWILLALAISASAVVYFDNPDALLHCFPLIATLALLVLLSRSKRAIKRLWLLLPIVLIMKPIEMIKSAQAYDYPAQRDFVIESLIEDQQPKAIITDPVMSRLGNYYLGFESERIQFYSFEEEDFWEAGFDKPTYYLKNPHSQGQSFFDDNDLPIEFQQLQSKPTLVEEEKLGIKVYDMNEEGSLLDKAVLELSVLNDFEAPIDPWNQRADMLRADPKDSSNQISFVPVYSSTFEANLEDFRKPAMDLLIVAQCKVNSPSKNQAKLVISLEDESGSYVWDAQDIDPFVKSYNNWWKLKFEKLVSAEGIKANSRLKIYLWNPDEMALLVDDIEVKIYSIKE